MAMDEDWEDFEYGEFNYDPEKDDIDEFSINRFSLDIEAENNPRKLRKYSKLYAQAQSKRRTAKRYFLMVQAEVAEEIRKKPEEWGITKGNDSVVFPIALRDEKVKKAYDEYIQWLTFENDLKGATEALKDRGNEIKILTHLWLNNYYSKIEVKQENIKNDPEFRIRHEKPRKMDLRKQLQSLTKK